MALLEQPNQMGPDRTGHTPIPDQVRGSTLHGNAADQSETRKHDGSRPEDDSSSPEAKRRRRRLKTGLALAALSSTVAGAIAANMVLGPNNSPEKPQPRLLPDTATSAPATTPPAEIIPTRPTLEIPALVKPPEYVLSNPKDKGKKTAQGLSNQLTWLANTPADLDTRMDNVFIDYDGQGGFSQTRPLVDQLTNDSKTSSPGENYYKYEFLWVGGKDGNAEDHDPIPNIQNDYSGRAKIRVTQYVPRESGDPNITVYDIGNVILKEQTVQDKNGVQRDVIKVAAIYDMDDGRLAQS